MTTTVMSAPVPPGVACVRYTQDCLLLAAFGIAGLNATNCPPGQPVTIYTGTGINDCAGFQNALLVLNAVNPILCGTSDCNAAVPYPPPGWTAVQNPCPSTAGASSCYLGATGPPLALAVLGASPAAVKSVPSNSQCASYTRPCAGLGASLGTAGPFVCPAGQSVTFYFNTTSSSCLTETSPVRNLNLTVCGASNCNAPAATPLPPVSSTNVLGQTCPSNSSAAACLYGLQGPPAALQAVYQGPVPSVSSTPVPAGTACVRFTLDCLIVVALGWYPLVNSSNCPPGQPVTLYQPMNDCSLQLTAMQAQNVLMCGSTDCNALLAFPPSWTAVKSPCPASAGASSCFLGATGPPAAVAALGLNPPVAMPVPNNSLCVVGTSSCSWGIANGLVNSSSCPVGQSVTMYLNTTVSSCLKDVQQGMLDGLTVCTTSNCNAPSATTTAAASTAVSTSSAALVAQPKTSSCGLASQLSLVAALITAIAWLEK